MIWFNMRLRSTIKNQHWSYRCSRLDLTLRSNQSWSNKFRSHYRSIDCWSLQVYHMDRCTFRLVTATQRCPTSTDHPYEERMLIRLLGSASSQGSLKVDLLLLLLISWMLWRERRINGGREERREILRRNNFSQYHIWGIQLLDPLFIVRH